MTTKRDLILEELAGQAKDDESTLWIGQVTEQVGGEYKVVVNARTVAREAVCSNDFAFASQGLGSNSIVGEYVIGSGSESNDLFFIIGSSPYAL